MLKLDGAQLDMGGREFTYDLPEPWGVDRGEAFLKITAKPAASVNADFRKSLDDVMHKARVRDLTVEEEYKASKNVDALVKGREDNAKWVTEAIATLRYDHCIVSWETDIQSGGGSLEANRDNFLALAAFEHRDIQALFAQMQADLSNFDKFALKASEEDAEAEVKN